MQSEQMDSKKVFKFLRYYFIVFVASFLAFLPMDMIIFDTTKDYVIDTVYVVFNFIMYSIIATINIISVAYFNKGKLRNVLILRFFIELIVLFVVFNMLLYVWDYFVLGRTVSLYQYAVTGLIHSKSILSNTVQLILSLFITEMVYQYEMRKRAEQEQQRIRYIQLKNQLNPHFLFNSLNILGGMVYIEQPNVIAGYTNRLASVCRYILEKSDDDLNSVEEELLFINDYIDILNTRFNGAIRFDCEIKNEMKHNKLPLLTFQLLVENAVKHNLFSEKEPLFIKIASQDDGMICVSNNVNPKSVKSPAASTGIGLKNLQERYLILCNKDIKIVKDEKMFRVYIPVITK